MGRTGPMGIPIMLLRLLLSVASSIVGLVGGVVVDCVNPVLPILRDDPTGLCAVVGPLGGKTGTWVGAGLVLFALIALILVWAPAARRRSRRQMRPMISLQDNLSRLREAEETSDPESSTTRSSADVLHLARLQRRLEAIETSLASSEVATREVTEQWMRLLREANDLHNEELIPTEDFKLLNTRLLDLFSPPRERPGETGQTSSRSTTSTRV